ncbi:hypothetical protein K2173_006378 [Erythroxylum novogranatense]|uniref:Uncharacterized protein n=1 Tax=Erythroxylum novogranatense TaxID=1862640 RepID=A0AAV8U3E7_9ROSI|nr:hypothetical protein K2173_006378 [Erythroxylum novogranatense]
MLLLTVTGCYTSWAKLFKIHCRAYKVIDHTIPQKPSDKGKESSAEVDPTLWSQLDATDNKNSCAVYLENQFSHVLLDDFSNISLSNVDALVSNQRLVLQLIAELNENYDGVATFIQQSDPLPPFYEACSRLIFEETRKVKQSATTSAAARTALLTAGIIDENTPSNRGSNYGFDNANPLNSNGQKRG